MIMESKITKANNPKLGGGYPIHCKTSFFTHLFNAVDSSGGGWGAHISVYSIKGMTNIDHKEVTLSFLNTTVQFSHLL